MADPVTQPKTRCDVVIVGARAAGSALANYLAQKGIDAIAIDRAGFPSDTMSTHVIYPNTLARLEDLGALAEVEASGPPPLYTAWHHEGRMFVAPHSPQRGRDYALCVRRITLDAILVAAARRAGARVLENTTVTGYLGTGTEADPLRGVVATGPDGATLEIEAPIVVGADGVNSGMARALGLGREKVMPTETMLYFAYWTGLPARNTQDFFYDTPWICAHFPADGGHHVVTMNGPVALRKEIGDLETFYMEKVHSIPGLRERLQGAERVSRVKGTPMLDGFYRQQTGPGWALLGDAAHFKHPAGAQGICDAFHAAEVLAQGIADGDWQRSYPAWRARESREFYAFCSHLREAPGDEGLRLVMDAMIADTALARKFVDIWARSARPWADVISQVPGMERITGASIEAALAPFVGAEKPDGVVAA